MPCPTSADSHGTAACDLIGCSRSLLRYHNNLSEEAEKGESDQKESRDLLRHA